eukprot:CAMPEP_0119100216 /NCGR_PEP_ID=MMETSP1178-20130426/185479_1 /TAXON_ID=33656 /ORGANISM="unid sp, Strain CCMP2000" /LENGTH=127 /DNA_ID=CAMNT_0007084197 /DNA_START=504 /DNA_END=884 /DNA_ORIENTATION=+
MHAAGGALAILAETRDTAEHAVIGAVAHLVLRTAQRRGGGHMQPITRVVALIVVRRHEPLAAAASNSAISSLHASDHHEKSHGVAAANDGLVTVAMRNATRPADGTEARGGGADGSRPMGRRHSMEL